MAVLLCIHGGFWWSDWAILPNFIDVCFGERLPFAIIVDLEGPASGTITAAFATFDLNNMHTSSQGHGEVKLSRLTISPNILLILRNNFSVN